MTRADKGPRFLFLVLIAASAGAAVLGFAREATVGALFGATRSTDAFYAALAIPFMAAYFLVGGALAPPLTAALASLLAKGETAAARRLFARASLWLLLGGAGVSGALVLFRVPIARALVPGFDETGILLTAELMRVLVVYGLLTALALLSAAALTSAGAYRAPVFSVLLGNAMSLLVLLLADRGAPIGVAARAMTAGAAATLLCLVPSLARLGFLGGWSRSAPELPWRKATVLLLSLAAAGAVDLLERPFASMTGPGSLALLAFASKLIHLPMRLIAAPLASVAFPLFVKSREKSPSSPAGETAHTTRWIVDLLFYSAAVTAGAAGPIVALTFGRGRFDSAAVSALSHVVALLAPAVVAIGAIEVASKLLLASDRASLVVVAQVLGLAVYAVAAPLLRSYGVSGLALARDLSWCTAAGILTIALARHQKDLGLTAGFARALIPCGAALGIATLATRMLPGGAILRGAAAASLAALVFFGLLAVSFLLVGRYAEGGVRPQ